MGDRREIVAGCRMPSDAGVLTGDKINYLAAKQGCDELARRIDLYLAKLRAQGEGACG